MMIFIWIWLSLTLLLWPSMYYFQCTCTVSRACVGEASAFGANEATSRSSTLSAYLNIRSNKMRESTVCDTFCKGISLMNHVTHCQLFRIAIIIIKRWIFPIDRLNNWFTWWNKTLVICMISTFLLHANFLYLFRMFRQEYFNIAYLLNYIYVDCYKMYA